jgi:hypothetical protein
MGLDYNRADMQLTTTEIGIKGRFVNVRSITFDGVEAALVVTGRLLKVARVKDEWYEDVHEPSVLVEKLAEMRSRVDILTFWQRLPETKPKYKYHMDWDSIAALRVESFEDWYRRQIDTNVRRGIRKAREMGVVVRLTEFDDTFVQGMASIFNETPVRQGRPFWHYGKDIQTLKLEFSRNLAREDVIGAYYQGELIGFIFLAYAGVYCLITQIISKLEHRDKATNNALLAKAVEICEEKNVAYLVYLRWNENSLSEFKRRNGFRKIDLPRYYIPLSLKGQIAMKAEFHHGLGALIPAKTKSLIRDLRNRYFSIRYPL